MFLMLEQVPRVVHLELSELYPLLMVGRLLLAMLLHMNAVLVRQL